MASFNLNVLYSQAFGIGAEQVQKTGAIDVLRANTLLPFLDINPNNQPSLTPNQRPPALQRIYKDLPTSCRFVLGEEEVTLPIPPVIEVQSRTNIVSTSVAGRNYTVKEIISVEDTRATLRGIIPPQYQNIVSIDGGGNVNLKSDEIDIRFYYLLQRMVGKTYEIFCPLLNQMGMWNAVFESINFPDATKYSGVILYQISLLADYPSELVLKDKNITQNGI